MNIKTDRPGAITSRLREADIRNGVDVSYDPLTGEVRFNDLPHGWMSVGRFQGQQAVAALHEELLHLKHEHWRAA